MSSLDTPKKNRIRIGLSIVAVVFIAFIAHMLLQCGSPSIVDDAAVGNPALQTEAPSAAPDQEPPPTARRVETQGSQSRSADPDPAIDETTTLAVDSSQRDRQPVERKPLLGGEVDFVIRHDKALADYPDLPVTIQISSILDPELADASLSKATSKTNIPGAVSTIPSGDTTWYLVLLGCFDSVEEAEAAVRSSEQSLREIGVSRVRIKPAPRSLRDRFTANDIQ